jgi:hypothetical protein
LVSTPVALAALAGIGWLSMRTSGRTATPESTPAVATEVAPSTVPAPLPVVPRSPSAGGAEIRDDNEHIAAAIAAIPPCPVKPPEEGSMCLLPAGITRTCTFGSEIKTRVCICGGSPDQAPRWHCQGTESVFVGECPKERPREHSACPSQGRTCPFEDDQEEAENAQRSGEAKEPIAPEPGELVCVCDLATGWSCSREIERGGK